MDYGASLKLSFLVVTLVVFASFLSPFTAEARQKLLHKGCDHHHNKGRHHVKTPRSLAPTTAPPASPPFPFPHNDYFPPPGPPVVKPPPPASPPFPHDDYFPPPPPGPPRPPVNPPALPKPPVSPAMPPAPSPNNNGMPPASAPSSAPTPSTSSDDITASAPAPPPPYQLSTPEAMTPDWTPPGYFPTNGIGFLCGEGPCWDSQYCNSPCDYCGKNGTCILEPDYDYDYNNNDDVPPSPPSSPPLSQSYRDNSMSSPPEIPPPECGNPPCRL